MPQWQRVGWLGTHAFGLASGSPLRFGDARAADPSAALLLDIDGVLHVGDEPLPEAIGSLERLRGLASGVRLVTNTTSKSRRAIAEHLRALGFDVADEEVLTPAALARLLPGSRL